MKKVWTTNARRSTATRTTTPASLSQRVELGLSAGASGGLPTSGGPATGGSSTANAGSLGSGVTGGRLDADAGARGSGRGWNDRSGVAAGPQQRAGERPRGGAV